MQILLGIILTKILFDQNTSNSKSDGSIDKYFGPDLPWKILKNIECFTTTLWFITRMVPSALKILKNIENYWKLLRNIEKKILKLIECFPTSLWFITRMVPICLATSFVISILATWNRITSVGYILSWTGIL